MKRMKFGDTSCMPDKMCASFRAAIPLIKIDFRGSQFNFSSAKPINFRFHAPDT